MSIDATDRRIIAATAGGLPLVPLPFAEVAGWLGLTEDEVLARVAQPGSVCRLRLTGLLPCDAHSVESLAQRGLRGCGGSRTRSPRRWRGT